MKNNKYLEIIEKNGSGFNLRVSDYLKSLGWETSPAKYYTDPATGKPREIDVVAKKKFPIGDSNEFVTVRLFIECKRVTLENVVWFVEKDEKKIRDLIYSNHIMKIAEDKDPSNIRKHHYLKENKVAILTGRDGHNDIFYDGWNNCLHSMISLENQEYGSYKLDYPLIVLDSFDKIHTPTDDDNNPSIQIKNNFEFGIDYSYKDEKKKIDNYFLVDVTCFDSLQGLLKEIEENDVRIAESLALGEIREQIWNMRFNQRNRNEDNFDPY